MKRIRKCKSWKQSEQSKPNKTRTMADKRLIYYTTISQPPNADFFHSSKEDCYLQIQYCQVWWYRSDMPVASDRTAEFDALGYVDMDTY